MCSDEYTVAFSEPLGFSTDDKHLKRAGLDYWNDVNITQRFCLLAHVAGKHLHLVTKFCHTYSEVNYMMARTIILEKKQRAYQKRYARKRRKVYPNSYE